MAPFIARWPLFRLLRPSPIGVVSALALLGVSCASVGAQEMTESQRRLAQERQGLSAPREINPFNQTGTQAPAALNGGDQALASPTPGAANYGKPRAKPDPRLKYPGRAVKPAHPLPDLVVYPRAPVKAVPNAPEAIFVQPPINYAQTPDIPKKKPPKVDADPYAPLGITYGGVKLLPYVESLAGYESNPYKSSGSTTSSASVHTEAGFSLLYDPHLFQLEASGRFNFIRYLTATNADRPEGEFKSQLHYPLARDSSADLGLRGSLSTQSVSSSDFVAQGESLSSRPDVFSVGTSLGFNQGFGQVSTSITALVDRTFYQNGRLTNGGSVNLASNDFTSLGLRGRLGYEVSPGISPFVDLSFDTRKRDNPIDSAGYQRESTGLMARMGTSFELSRLLTGQIAAGYMERAYQDARLSRINGPAFESALIWTATPLTTVTLRGTTEIGETTLAGASGTFSRRLALEVAHALRRNFTVKATAALQGNHYQGVSLQETQATGSLQADYALSRSMVVRGSFTHERLKSSLAGNDYTANALLLGLRLQR
ncbi:MAG: hypothetical protein EBY21_04065 [Alphaproteobacteria bacterium]|nr:hypothetical protein [Alphaproteobacteria bacterium]